MLYNSSSINRARIITRPSRNIQTAQKSAGKPASEENKKDNITGSTPLIRAAIDGLFWGVNSLIKSSVDVNEKDSDGMTALMHAANRPEVPENDEKYYRVVCLLLANGADANARDNKGRTALMLADSVQTFGILIETGADVAIKDNDGKTVFSLLTENLSAIGDKELEKVKLLVAAKADGNERDKNGHTFISRLVRSGDVEKLKKAIAAGSDINARDKDGKTPLMIAELSGKIEVVKILKEAEKAGAKK